MGIKLKINFMGNDRDFGAFCAARDKLIGCKAEYCHATCAAGSLRFAQRQCDRGATVGAAVKKWVLSRLTHKQGEQIVADYLGVKDMAALREYLSRETS